MSLDNIYNVLSKELSFGENLEDKLEEVRERCAHLDQARATMAKGYAQVLEGLKQAYPQMDLDDANIVDSPNRMARALLELCRGLGCNWDQIFATTFPSEGYSGLVLLKDIDFLSVCSHHFMTFSGKAHVGYIPSPNRGVLGLSKLARVVDGYACRPQLQERLTVQISQGLQQAVNPLGTMVVLKASHSCLTCRGAKKPDSMMTTVATTGVFEQDPSLRNEFFESIR